MRQVKFDNSKSSWDSDDIKYAFECNGLSERLNDIECIVAEVCGSNDEYDWYWILQMKDGTFSNAQGGCDYTGWDCQSSADIKDGFKTPEEAIDKLDLGSEHRPNIKWCLSQQILEKLPFAIYQEDNN
jgi:hypothetical protein